ncbi:MAG TPA: PVC-type heme-binding CxxCH protein, partial [Humisphaera sp.]|nr:PVC-type heme-binding CxxCH protein [Humisphaera sp.]
MHRARKTIGAKIQFEGFELRVAQASRLCPWPRKHSRDGCATSYSKLPFFVWCCFVLAAIAITGAARGAADEAGPLRAGAAIVDATPTAFPVIVNGMFETRSATAAHDPINVRCVVVEQGATRIAIAVVDSCMVPRDLIDQAKSAAEKSTGIPADHMLVSATHTHEAPAAMGGLGTDADPEYVKFLPPRIALAIEQAAKNLQPARAGWSSIDAPQYTFNRRWIYRPDRLRRDPFGELTVRAMMNPGFLSSDTISVSGPVDSQLSLLSFQSLDGKPIAMLANYSMHYFGAPMLSADYFGIFCDHFAKAIGADKSSPAFVAIMSQGTSGDLTSNDYSQPKRKTITIEQYSDALVALAKQAYDGISYHEKLPLAMKETKIMLHRRVADAERLEKSRAIVAKMKGPSPKGLPEVYAREQLLLAAKPTAELKLQAIRIGDLGITAIPNEVFSLTGLKLKSRSPLPATFNIELANGAEGYIPPPEQHKLGGYTTWAARSAGLEVEAEPKIVEAVLTLLEEVSGQPRRKGIDVRGAYAQAVAASKPAAFWPLSEMDGTIAADIGSNNHPGSYEDGIALALDGPQFPASHGEAARAVHFAGGRMKAAVPNLGTTWSAELWFWNGLANNARPITGYLLSRGRDGAEEAAGEHLGIGGTSEAEGKLIFFNGRTLHQTYMGNTEIPLRSWNDAVLVRDGRGFAVYLNGNKTPEIEGQADIGVPIGVDEIFLGGRNDHLFNLEGRICQASVYSRALGADEIVAHYKASGMAPKPNTANASIVPTKPLSPEESLKVIHVPDGFAVDLVAAEPLIMDPVAVAWGADRKLWVVEMADYPSGIDGKMKAGGRVRFLESTKGDGHYDKSTLFMDGINFPTGILPWRKGVIVTAAPEIFYAEDTTGSGKADKKEVLYSGFREGNAQLRVNGLRWGVDGWIYCANGWSGGVVKSIKTGETVNINGRDFRIRPDEGLIELQSGMTENGRDCDDWGDWFGCDNSNPLFHFPLEDRYFRRNKLATPPPAKIQLEVPVNPKLYPRSTPQKRYHTFEHSDHFTSACSATIYRDWKLFGSSKDGSMHAFTCEPVHNLVHHEIVRESGVSFTAVRPEEEKESEFFASEDQWCRPVMVRTGPDGALWVVDMYRYIIEHPDWLPPVGKAELAKYWRLGEDKGRIYRVYRNDQERPWAWRRHLEKEPTTNLVVSLGSHNGWERDTAQELLLWRHDMNAVPELEDYAVNCGWIRMRLTALCTLDLLGALKAETIELALKDKNPAVRRQAVRLAEARAKNAPQLIDAAIKLVDDPDAKVRLQLACTLGEWDGANVGAALAKIAVKDADDVTIAGAVMS